MCQKFERYQHMDTKIIELLKILPPIVACLVWDVIHKNITPETIELADKVTDDEWEQYEIVRCLAAGNPKHPPLEEAKVLVEMMAEDLVYQTA